MTNIQLDQDQAPEMIFEIPWNGKLERTPQCSRQRRTTTNTTYTWEMLGNRNLFRTTGEAGQFLERTKGSSVWAWFDEDGVSP